MDSLMSSPIDGKLKWKKLTALSKEPNRAITNSYILPLKSDFDLRIKNGLIALRVYPSVTSPELRYKL
jgi:hypothetical protein